MKPEHSPISIESPTVEEENPVLQREGDIARKLMQSMSLESNKSLGEKIIGPDGRLKMFMFGELLGKKEMAADSTYVRTRKVEWAKLDDPAMQASYIERYGLKEKALTITPDQLTEMLLRAIDDEKIEQAGNLAEVAATLLLHYGLGEKFAIVRASAYDDIKNGVDTLIVNKETGEVVCAFDELVGDRNRGTDERLRDKARRQKEIIEHGGTRVKYGLTIKDGRMVKQSFEHVPVFRLCLGRVEVNAVLNECDQSEGELGPTGTRVLGQLIDSLETQTKEYLANDRLDPSMRSRLEQYRDGSLQDIRTLVGLKTTATQEAA